PPRGGAVFAWKKKGAPRRPPAAAPRPKRWDDKALLSGSRAVKVDAYQTSQACPECGYASEDNRPEKGLLFRCQVCHLVLHADLVGASNVALQTLLIRHDWVRTGVLSERPEVSDQAATAVQRRRYAALRWSPDASPPAFAGGI